MQNKVEYLFGRKMSQDVQTKNWKVIWAVLVMVMFVVYMIVGTIPNTLTNFAVTGGQLADAISGDTVFDDVTYGGPVSTFTTNIHYELQINGRISRFWNPVNLTTSMAAIGPFINYLFSQQPILSSYYAFAKSDGFFRKI